jgi:hypothetical protein
MNLNTPCETDKRSASNTDWLVVSHFVEEVPTRMFCCSLEHPDRFLRYRSELVGGLFFHQSKRIHAMDEHNNHAVEFPPGIGTLLGQLPYVMLAPLTVTLPIRLYDTVKIY